MSYFKQHHPKMRVVRGNIGDYVKAAAYETFKIFGLKQSSFYDSDSGRKARLVPLPVIWKTPLELWIETANFIHGVHPLTNIEALFAILPPDADVVIIGDMRRRHETEWLKARGAYLVNVERPGRLPISNIDTELVGYDGWNDWIKNDGDLSELEPKVKVICERILT
jgi:hypothetical protein